jgi:hypothetical protein
VHRAQRHRREQEVGGVTAREQGRFDREVARLRGGFLGAEVQGRADEDVPEAVDRGLRLPSGTERVGEGHG